MANHYKCESQIRWLPTLSMWDVKRSPNPAQGGPAALPGTPSLLGQTHLQATAFLFLCQLSAQTEHQLSAASWCSRFQENLGVTRTLVSRKTVKKEKFNSHPKKHMPHCWTCSASRSPFQWAQWLSTKHCFCMNDGITERTTAPTWTAPC